MRAINSRYTSHKISVIQFHVMAKMYRNLSSTKSLHTMCIPYHLHYSSTLPFLQSCASNDTFTHIPIWHSFETNKSINKLRKIIVISFGRLADNLRIDVFFSPCERKRNHIITKCVVCSTFFYDLFSASPSLPIHLLKCMQECEHLYIDNVAFKT